jgi:hypothetical protein
LTRHRHYDIDVLRKGQVLSITSLRRIVMAKSKDVQKDTKKKPAKTAREKKLAKQAKKK